MLGKHHFSTQSLTEIDLLPALKYVSSLGDVQDDPRVILYVSDL